jgi:hypothetical protein
MAAVAGFYIIRNDSTNNRYVGKTHDFQQRFNARMLTINEFGLSQNDLNGIDAFWGQVEVYNSAAIHPGGGISPAPLPPNVTGAAGFAQTMPAAIPHAIGGFNVLPQGVGLAPANPAAAPNRLSGQPNYNAAVVRSLVDGQVINLEHLLIRFVRQSGWGGTITNGAYINIFTNATANRMDVVVEWAAGSQTNIAAGYQEIQINAGANM